MTCIIKNNNQVHQRETPTENSCECGAVRHSVSVFPFWSGSEFHQTETIKNVEVVFCIVRYYL